MTYRSLTSISRNALSRPEPGPLTSISSASNRYWSILSRTRSSSRRKTARPISRRPPVIAKSSSGFETTVQDSIREMSNGSLNASIKPIGHAPRPAAALVWRSPSISSNSMAAKSGSRMTLAAVQRSNSPFRSRDRRIRHISISSLTGAASS